MQKRIVSLWLPELSTDRLNRQHRGRWRGKPLATVDTVAGQIIVQSANHIARLAGVAPGMSLADARTLLPSLVTMEADPRADAALLERLARWCHRYTPWVGVNGVDGLWLDVTGCAHLFGGEQSMLDRLLNAIERLGLCVRGALAETPGAASALARWGKSGAVVGVGEVGDAIAALPVTALRLEPRTAVTLRRLGLKQIRDLCSVPRASLAARFGQALLLRLDQALGRAPEPIVSQRLASDYRVRLAFAESIGHRDDIVRGLEYLLKRLCERLVRAELGCRRLEFTIQRSDNTTQAVAIGTARPARDAMRLARLFEERLDTVDPGFGIDAMTLGAPVTEAYVPPQSTIVADTSAGIRDLDVLLDRLGNRLGFESVQCFRPRQSHIPERAFRVVSASEHVTRDNPAVYRVGARPMRLLKKPEMIRAIVSLPGEQSEEPPRRFLWRRDRYTVRTALGPERIMPEWWHGDSSCQGGARDYWQVEDEVGYRFWIFREAESFAGVAPCWFLHGLFL